MQKLKRLLKETVRHIIVNSLKKHPHFFPIKQPKILFYHGVAEKPNPLIEIESISINNFISQLKYIQKYYQVISIEDFYERYLNSNFDGHEIVLTFDDGYRNILTNALPILCEFKFPFSVFLTTNNISNQSLFPTTIARLIILGSSLKDIEIPFLKQKCRLSSLEERIIFSNSISKYLKCLPLHEVKIIIEELITQLPSGEMEELRKRYNSVEPMNWNEAVKLSCESLVSMGSHCIDHICCHDKQSDDEIYKQLKLSRDTIIQKIKCKCDILSYPNGNYTQISNNIAKEVGYKFALSTKRESILKNNEKEWNIFPRLYVPYDYERFVYSLISYPY